MIAFPDKKYSIIYADPPWSYNNWSKLKTDALNKKCGRPLYSQMTTEEIGSLPISSICEKDCILFIWATCPCLHYAMEVIQRWGFLYKGVAFSWVKLNPKGVGYFSGLGNWTLGNVELLLLATHKTFPKRQKPVKQLLVSPVGRHSQKPAEARERIVEMMGDLPRIELFARERVEGWDAWGDQL